jgi:hypothetical protein
VPFALASVSMNSTRAPFCAITALNVWPVFSRMVALQSVFTL